MEQLSGGECPRCGAAYEPLQEYCIECGLRLPLDRGIGSAVGRAWRLEVSRYPGWLWVVLVLLALTAFATVAAILASGEGESAVRTIVATAPPPTARPTTPTVTAFQPTTTAPATTDTVTTTRPPRQTRPIEWPDGRNRGWLLTMASYHIESQRTQPSIQLLPGKTMPCHDSTG